MPVRHDPPVTVRFGRRGKKHFPTRPEFGFILTDDAIRPPAPIRSCDPPWRRRCVRRAVWRLQPPGATSGPARREHHGQCDHWDHSMTLVLATTTPGESRSNALAEPGSAALAE